MTIPKHLLRRWTVIGQNACQVLKACFILFSIFHLGNAPAYAQSPCSSPYTVQSGDYLTGIAVKCKIAYVDLLSANPQITNPSTLKVGQQINIPGGIKTEPTTTEPATAGVENSSEAAPIDTVQAFYTALEQGLTQGGDLSLAYGYFSNARRKGQSLSAFQKLYIVTDHVQILHIKLIEQKPTSAQIGLIVATDDRVGGQITTIQYDAIYPLLLEDGLWRIGATNKYVEIGVLSQTALNQWYSNDISKTVTDPTPTSSTSATNQDNTTLQCKGNSPLDVGKTAVVTPGDPNTLFVSAGGKAIRDSQQRTVEIPAGDKIPIVGGPQCVGSWRYWEVTFGEYRGWTAEGNGTAFWLRLPTAQSDQCPGYLTPQLTIGERAVVLPGAPNTLWEHVENSPAPKELEKMLPGTTILVLDGPKCKDGYVYWRVRSEKSGNQGWTAESHVDENYYLERK